MVCDCVGGCVPCSQVQPLLEAMTMCLGFVWLKPDGSLMDWVGCVYTSTSGSTLERVVALQMKVISCTDRQPSGWGAEVIQYVSISC